MMTKETMEKKMPKRKNFYKNLVDKDNKVVHNLHMVCMFHSLVVMLKKAVYGFTLILGMMKRCGIQMNMKGNKCLKYTADANHEKAEANTADGGNFHICILL